MFWDQTQSLQVLWVAMLGAFGYYVPFTHMVKFANDNNVSAFRSASLLNILGVSSMIGRIVFGFVSDRRKVAA